MANLHRALQFLAKSFRPGPMHVTLQAEAGARAEAASAAIALAKFGHVSRRRQSYPA